MKFKKLEVAGFKSFADRLEVKFGSGITGIVGPNGCGKSNVADSIRWVLGEQSAKLLRGSSMQDVIFNGTEVRKSLSFCEVNLYFDNTEKLFPSLDYNEVVISRKLYRSGESEYCLNKAQCRLKDITDLLRDSGMGREGYSIIGQGRIDELLSAKPEDRRAIFEEAAGISKFKARKQDAERKLNRTRENLIRIVDILDEKAKMLEPLTKQSEAARKWLELRDKLRIYEINTYIYQFESANEAKEAINNRLNGVIEEIDLRQKEYDIACAEYNEAMQAVNEVDKNIESLREELLTLTVGMEKQAGEIKLYNERLSYLNSQSERIISENVKLNEDYNTTLEFIGLGTASRDEKAAELKKQQDLSEKYNEEYLKVIDTLTQGEGEVESHHRAVLEAMDKLADIKANMFRLIAEREGLTTNVGDLNKRIDNINDKIAEDNASVELIKNDLDGYNEIKKQKSNQIEHLFTVNNECLSQVATSAREIDSISAEFYMTKSKHKMLTELQQSYEGFAYSVKNLLNDAKTKPELSCKIEGVVAQLVTVKEGFEVAIEMALGNAVQNIVTPAEEDAKFLIEYLKKSRYGRVTFLPIPSIKPRSLDKEYEQHLSMQGCYGVASSVISYDAKYANIFSGLLGGTVVVDNMDTAIALARKTRYGLKIVTLDGDIINPHGSITGGSKKSELSNVFGYDKEISELTPKLENMGNRLNELNALRSAKADEQKAVSEKIKDLRDEIHKIEVDIATKSETYNKLCLETVELNEEVMVLKSESERASNRIEAITTDINSVGELEQIVQGKKASANESSNEQKQQFDALRKERDRLHELMTSARVKYMTLDTEISGTDTEIRRLQNNIITITDKLEYNNNLMVENDAIIEQLESDMKAFTSARLDTDTDNVKSIRNKLGNLDEFKQEKQNSLTELDKKRSDLTQNLTQLQERKNREEMQLVKVDSDIEVMQQRVQEEYDLEYEACLPFKEENYDLNKGITESNRLKRQMSSLGNVNLGAIEQCQQVYESYHEMDVQREDLVKAENDLLKIIKELSNEMLGRFTNQFEQIRVNFVKIFKELFDGGTADLILMESENPLEAGIEIVAQPPQKKLQSISLLSGGERALTAIAILFAILRLKPMPFCVLDEIEAALDDANAGRFAKYLRRFSEDTQFIVITHRKPTMELADSLYGVTMEEKGVSKIVSVKLSDAINFDSQAAE